MSTVAVTAALASRGVKTLVAMGCLLAACAHSVSADSGPNADTAYDAGDVSALSDAAGGPTDTNAACLDEPILFSGEPCNPGVQAGCQLMAQTLVDGGTVHETCVANDQRTGGWCVPADFPLSIPDADACRCGTGPACPINQLCISDAPDSSAHCVCLGM